MDRDHNYPNLTQAIILILLFWGLSRTVGNTRRNTR